MTQLIEGVDNEITLAFFLFTGAAAIAVPWYLLRPNRSALYNTGRANQFNSQGRIWQNSREGYSETAAAAQDTVNHERSNAGHTVGEQSPTNTSNLGGSNEESFQSHASNQGDTTTYQNSPSENDNDSVTIINIKIKHNAVDTFVSVPKTMRLINFKRYEMIL